ncbi:MAG TPA: thioredoxin family protein [Armatimonadota bacterium]|jgi:thioredoxin 1
MKLPIGKVAIIALLCLAIVGVLYLKGRQSDGGENARQLVTPVAGAPDAAPAAPSATVPTPATTSPAVTKPAPSARQATGIPAKKPAAKSAASAPAKPVRTPRLLELGADKCIPCKMMQPVLAALRKDYAGKLQVDFIDVWKDPAAGEQYGIQTIPTQIFFDADGKEIFRHTGFYPQEDIVAKFAELGINL